MGNSSIVTVMLPMALAVIMLGLGLSLTLVDFRRVLVYPRAVFVALGCQVLLLPALCFVLVKCLALPPPLAVGMMLLAASPGGTTASLYSHLADGDVALNITLTAINSLLAILTLPVMVNLSLLHFYEDGQAIPLHFSEVLQIFAVVLIPVVVGMGVRRRRPAFAARLQRPVKHASMLFLFAVVALITVKEWSMLRQNIGVVGLAALGFNLTSLLVGYGVPRLVHLDHRQATAIGMEIGLHNGTLAIAVAVSPQMLNNPAMAIPAAVYGLIAFVTAAVFAWLLSTRRARRPLAPAV